MEQLNTIAAKFFALPLIHDIFQSHAMLRIASKDYGVPLFLILCAIVFLVLLLLATKLKPQKGRPKIIKDSTQEKERSPLRIRKDSKSKGTPKAIIRKLEKLPASTLPLYPVADKKRQPPSEVQEEAILDDLTAMAVPASDADILADIEAQDRQVQDMDQPTPDDQRSDPALDKDTSPAPSGQFESGISSDDFDFTVPSFGDETTSAEPAPTETAPTETAAAEPSPDKGKTLSDEARRKFAELQQRGMTS